jgi:hypothetical protein
VATKPDRCITCGHAIPDGQDHPHYFGQNATRDITAGDLIEEVRNLSNSLAALCDAITELSDKDPMDGNTRKMLSQLYGLSWDLGREISQRAEFAYDMWQNNAEPGYATGERKED